MKPYQNKSPEFIKALHDLFPELVDNVNKGNCPFCGTVVDPIRDFRDDLSRKEYTISGLCQKCQDEVFK